MFRCLTFLQSALLVILGMAMVFAMPAPVWGQERCANLFAPEFQRVNWDREIILALAIGENRLDEESLQWIKSNFLRDVTGKEIDWNTVTPNLRRRIVGMLSPTFPANEGKRLGDRTETDIKMLAVKNPDKKSYAELEALKNSLDWENISAGILKEFKFYIVQNPDTSNVLRMTYPAAKAKQGISKNRRPDYFILNRGNVADGRVFDHFFSRAELQYVVSGILNKTRKLMADGTEQRQTTRVVVNLCDNPFFNGKKFNLADLRESLRKSSADDNLEEVIVIHGTTKETVQVERVFP